MAFYTSWKKKKTRIYTSCHRKLTGNVFYFFFFRISIQFAISKRSTYEKRIKLEHIGRDLGRVKSSGKWIDWAARGSRNSELFSKRVLTYKHFGFYCATARAEPVYVRVRYIEASLSVCCANCSPRREGRKKVKAGEGTVTCVRSTPSNSNKGCTSCIRRVK